jgi:AraC family transcriptional regulator of arabinose operon
MLDRSQIMLERSCNPGTQVEIICRMDHRVRVTIETMEHRLRDPLPIRVLAAQVDVSPSRLAHLFVRDTGMSPSRFLRALRMRCAAALLERTNLAVKDVMQEVGCADPSHFSRDFRSHHGVPPTAYRRNSLIASHGTNGL